MAPQSPQLPPKPEVALALLQTASSVYVHLDPRGENVAVPAWFKKQPQLVLQVGLNMAVPIPDLDVGREAISCTLSFNRRPEFCRIPWSAIYGLVGEDGRGMIWPDSVPAEVAAAADGRSPVGSSPRPRPKLRLASSAEKAAGGTDGAAPGGSPPKDSPQAEAQDSGSQHEDGQHGQVQHGQGQHGQGQHGQGSPERGPHEGRTSGQDSSGAPPAFVTASSASEKKRKELPPYLRVVK